jgi:hypothetical protein
LSELEAIQPMLGDKALRRAGLQYSLYRGKVQTALFRKDLGFVCRQHVDAGDDLHNQLRRSAAAQFAHAKNLRSRGCKDVTAAVKQLNFPADHTAQRPGARAGLAAADRRVENMRFIAANLLASI